jgi:RNA polymerase sigma-70 factor (ECF subfamily)
MASSSTAAPSFLVVSRAVIVEACNHHPAVGVHRSDMTEQLTARLARDLDGAFEELVRDHQDTVYGVALRLVGDPHDAEDIAQDAFVRAYRALAGWPPGRIRELRVRPWLARITLNLVRNRARARRPTEPLEHDPPADPEGGPTRVLERKDTSATLARLLGGLPERYRAPLVLRCVEGLGYAEVAEALGRPVGTVKAQVHRGLGLLRQALDTTEELP